MRIFPDDLVGKKLALFHITYPRVSIQRDVQKIGNVAGVNNGICGVDLDKTTLDIFVHVLRFWFHEKQWSKSKNLI